MIAMKGPDAAAELAAAQKAITQLGGRAETPLPVTLPAVGEEAPARRVLLPIQKISTTPAVYPRPSAKIAKHPL